MIPVVNYSCCDNDCENSVNNFFYHIMQCCVLFMVIDNLLSGGIFHTVLTWRYSLLNI